MFFSFPDGCDSIAVDQQNFEVEFVDPKGVMWFRAPETFASKILGLGMGFHALAPGDIPEGCELDDKAVYAGNFGKEIGDQAVKIAVLSDEVRLANEASQRATNELRQVESQVLVLSAKNKDLEEENEKLKARLDEFESAQQTREALSTIDLKVKK